ncbi:MAG: hypothetical protein KAI03_03815 [Candidatus Aureabacteria bacterium]|nr:hypothetical protein [Candidatus Auribacterota bacterium]
MADNFGKNIFTRSSIAYFFKMINSSNEKVVILNFAKVEFISRSCADEYLKQKERTDKKIIEESMSSEVCAMFRNVENQYKREGFKISFEICPASRLVLA